jgi:hypothetical protein
MSRRGAAALVVLAVWGAGRAGAAPPDPAAALAALNGGSTAALSGSLRGLLLEFLPDPLFEDNNHWGKQHYVEEVRWRGKGLHVHPEKARVLKNDGHWHKVRVTAPRARDTLVVDLRDVQQPEPGRMTFVAFVSFDADVDYDKQHWEDGVKLYGAGVRARLRVRLTLWCEAVTRLEPKGKLLPDAVFRLRVTRAEVGFDNLVVEHVAGVGGDAARVLGDAARACLHQWRPSLEKRLLDRAAAAIVKAGDTKEVRISLSKLMGN